MNMTITESDKRLLSFLAAVLLLLLLAFLVLRPLADKNSDLKRQITAAKDQEVVMDLGAALAEDAGTVEEETGEQLEETLKRYYQNLQSQDAEKMVTTLLLNHRMQIKNLTVTMPDTKSDLKWYQYSEKAATEIAGEEKIEVPDRYLCCQGSWRCRGEQGRYVSSAYRYIRKLPGDQYCGC